MIQFVLVGARPRLVLIATEDRQLGVYVNVLWITLVETRSCTLLDTV